MTNTGNLDLQGITLLPTGSPAERQFLKSSIHCGDSTYPTTLAVGASAADCVITISFTDYAAVEAGTVSITGVTVSATAAVGGDATPEVVGAPKVITVLKSAALAVELDPTVLSGCEPDSTASPGKALAVFAVLRCS